MKNMLGRIPYIIAATSISVLAMGCGNKGTDTSAANAGAASGKSSRMAGVAPKPVGAKAGAQANNTADELPAGARAGAPDFSTNPNSAGKPAK